LPAEVERRLAAILMARVEGYTRLMRRDEAATVSLLADYRGVMRGLIEARHGRVVDSPGGSLMAEFSSVVEAVQAAVEIQRQLAARNAGLEKERRLIFRIGVTCGDVLAEENRLYGQWINLAARLEKLAEPGGVFISDIAFSQVKGRLDLGFDCLGDFAVKNIDEPVRIYRVVDRPGAGLTSCPPGRRGRRLLGLLGALAVAALIFGAGFWLARTSDQGPAGPGKEAPALAPPARPSIVVLPFANLSPESEHDYLSDGITESLITDLSRISGLFVIARNTAFSYKKKDFSPAQVGRDLGVRYLLQGSVRRQGRQVRVTAELVDAASGSSLWSESYDREMEDVFNLEDEVTREIVTALKVKLTEEERARRANRYKVNPEAYDYFLRGQQYTIRFSREANAQARRLYERAVKLDPDYALAYVGLGWTYFQEFPLGWSPAAGSLNRAEELARKAIALDPELPQAYVLLGWIELWQKKHDQAVAAGEKALDLDPNNADSMAFLSHALAFADRPGEAVELIGRAMRLNPRYPAWYLFYLGHAQILLGRAEEAVESLRQALLLDPKLMAAQVMLAAALAELGRLEEAGAAVKDMLALNPDYSLQIARQRLPYKDKAVLERMLRNLARAGLK